MPLSIPNTTVTSTSYTSALTFAGTDVFAWGFFTIANNPVFVQLAEGPQGQAVFQDEVYCPPATYPIAGGDRNPAGIRFRANSLAAPLPQVFGSLFYPREPGIQAGTPFAGTISPGGGLTGVAGVVGYQEFTAPVSTAANVEVTPLTVASLTGITWDGATPVVFEFFCPMMVYPAAGAFGVSLWDMTSVIDLGRMSSSGATATNATGFLAGGVPNVAVRRFTPAAGQRDYAIRMWRTAGTFTLQAGVGGVGAFLPGYFLARTDPNA